MEKSSNCKFATSINNTSEKGGKHCHRCRWYRWCTLTSKYLREFSKKIETVLTGYSGAWGKLIHEKNQKQKISWHCPFKWRIHFVVLPFVALAVYPDLAINTNLDPHQLTSTVPYLYHFVVYYLATLTGSLSSIGNSWLQGTHEAIPNREALVDPAKAEFITRITKINFHSEHLRYN